jgi:signal transduction histidine kinase
VDLRTARRAGALRLGRHAVVVGLLALAVPVLALLGVRDSWTLGHVAAEVVVPLLGFLAVAGFARRPRVAAGAGAMGLMYVSAVLIHVTGGVTEAHFAFFVAFGLVAVYRDWLVFFAAAAFAVGHHVLFALAGESLFAQPYQLEEPLLWAAIHVSVVTLVTAVQAVGMYDVSRSAAAKTRLETELTRAEERRGTALRLHDDVVQALATANYARSLGEEELGSSALEEALQASRALVSELLGDGPVDRDVLERHGPALPDELSR